MSINERNHLRLAFLWAVLPRKERAGRGRPVRSHYRGWAVHPEGAPMVCVSRSLVWLAGGGASPAWWRGKEGSAEPANWRGRGIARGPCTVGAFLRGNDLGKERLCNRCVGLGTDYILAAIWKRYEASLECLSHVGNAYLYVSAAVSNA